MHIDPACPLIYGIQSSSGQTVTIKNLPAGRSQVNSTMGDAINSGHPGRTTTIAGAFDNPLSPRYSWPDRTQFVSAEQLADTPGHPYSQPEDRQINPGKNYVWTALHLARYSNRKPLLRQDPLRNQRHPAPELYLDAGGGWGPENSPAPSHNQKEVLALSCAAVGLNKVPTHRHPSRSYPLRR